MKSHAKSAVLYYKIFKSRFDRGIQTRSCHGGTVITFSLSIFIFNTINSSSMECMLLRILWKICICWYMQQERVKNAQMRLSSQHVIQYVDLLCIVDILQVVYCIPCSVLVLSFVVIQSQTARICYMPSTTSIFILIS